MRSKRSVTNQLATAIKQHDLDVDTAVRYHRRCGLPRCARDLIAHHIGGGRAGAGGPTAAERAVLRAHWVAYSAPDRSRHGGTCQA
jgi:hypothetical protein